MHVTAVNFAPLMHVTAVNFAPLMHVTALLVTPLNSCDKKCIWKIEQKLKIRK